MDKKRTKWAWLCGLLVASAAAHSPAEQPFVGFYRDVQPHMVTELFLLPDQRFCHRLHTHPTHLAISGRWESTVLHNGHHITLQAESPYPSPYVLQTTDTDSASGQAAAQARRLTVNGASFAQMRDTVVLFGWNSHPAWPDNLAPLLAPEYRPTIGDTFILDLPREARYVFLGHGSSADGYRISRFDTGKQPHLWLTLEPGAMLQHAPISALFHQGNLQMLSQDFGAPKPISAQMQRKLEQNCLRPWPKDLPKPLPPETEEYRHRLPRPNRPNISPWIKPAAKPPFFQAA